MVLALSNVVQTLVAVTLLRRWCPACGAAAATAPLDSPWATVRYVGALAVGMAAGHGRGLASAPAGRRTS